VGPSFGLGVLAMRRISRIPSTILTDLYGFIKLKYKKKVGFIWL